jgi:hypothetical protein
MVIYPHEIMTVFPRIRETNAIVVIYDAGDSFWQNEKDHNSPCITMTLIGSSAQKENPG